VNFFNKIPFLFLFKILKFIIANKSKLISYSSFYSQRLNAKNKYSEVILKKMEQMKKNLCAQHLIDFKQNQNIMKQIKGLRINPGEYNQQIQNNLS